jgi:hypothetical protein
MIIEHEGESYIKLSALYDAVQKPVIMAPFLGVMLPVVVRRLSQVQIRACGDFSLIETISDIIAKSDKKSSVEDMVKYAEVQYEVVKRSLVSPTYDEIMSLNEYDVLRKNTEKELKELEDILNDMGNSSEKTKLMVDYNTAMMNSKFLLPIDFVAFITSYALRVDESDIKEVTEDMLFEAAFKATKGHDNPSDHLHGLFSDFNKEDINNRAWIIYYERNKK